MKGELYAVIRDDALILRNSKIQPEEKVLEIVGGYNSTVRTLGSKPEMVYIGLKLLLDKNPRENKRRYREYEIERFVTNREEAEKILTALQI